MNCASEDKSPEEEVRDILSTCLSPFFVRKSGNVKTLFSLISFVMKEDSPIHKCTFYLRPRSISVLNPW
jgi:hypothetical protein